MNKARQIPFSLLMSGALFTPIALHASERNLTHSQIATESTLMRFINTRVLETLERSHSIPGLQFEEFATLRTTIAPIWHQLMQAGVLRLSGTDQETRLYFVALQGIVEHVLASELNQSITGLTGVIHTPMPPTPLCNKGEISKELVDPSIECDPARLFTVKARTTLLRDYLFKGGTLYCVYPKGGFEKRTQEQQDSYLQELVRYPNHLFDLPLECENIPLELIGATYLFQDALGTNFLFSIQMTQANNPQDSGHFGLWFGPLDHPTIQERFQAVSSYLKQYNVPVLNQ